MFNKSFKNYFSTFLISSIITLTPFASVLAAQMNVNYLDIGQGDSELIQLPDGKNILIDAGDREASKKILDFLKIKKIKKLDLVIISHPHLDHYGGLLGVIKQIPVTEVYDSGAPTSSTTYLSLLKQLSANKTKFSIVRKGQEFNYTDNIKISILSPEDPLLKNTKSDANNASIVIKLTHNKVSFLFTGDIEDESEEKILNESKSALKSDILKVAHHGSRYTSSKEFLDNVQPKVAVISSGQGNSYGHPHQETLQRLADNKIKLYRTDLQGDITISSDGETYKITNKKSSVKPIKKKKVDLNKATSEELELLPGFNSIISKKLIAMRPINSWTDLSKLGIKSEQVNEIKALAFFSKISEKDNIKITNSTTNNGEKININTATKAQLVALPGIGEVTADKIISGRPYKKLDDLKRIPGVKNRMKKFIDLITVN